MKNRNIVNFIFSVFIILSLSLLSKRSYSLIAIKEVLFILTTFIFFLYFIYQKKLKIFLFDIVFFLFVSFNLILLLFVKVKYFSTLYLDVLLTSTFFYILLRYFSGKFLSILLEIIGGISALYGIFLYLGVDLFNFYANTELSRTPSFFGNSNFFAGVLIVFISITIINLMKEKDLKFKVVHSIVLFLDIIAMFLTKTRAAFFGLLISFIILFYYIIKYKLLNKYFLYTLIALLILVPFFVPKDYWGRIKALKDISHGTPMFRVYTWNSTLKIIKEHPLGVGPGNFRVYYPKYKSKRIFLFEGHHNAETIHAHNDLLENATDMGIFGFFIYLLLIFLLIKIYIFYIPKLLKDKRSRSNGMILIGLYAALMGLLTDNIFSVNLKWLSSIIIFYFIIGTTFAIISKYEKPIIKLNLKPYFFLFVLLFFALFIPSIRRYKSNMILQKAIVYSKYGVQLRAKKEVNKAMKYFINAEKLYSRSLSYNKNNVIGLYFMGNQQIDIYTLNKTQENLKNAMHYYKKVQKISPNYVQIHFLKGKVYYYLKDYKKAEDEFTKYLDQDPVDPQVYNYLVEIYNKADRKKDIKNIYLRLKKEVDQDLNIKPDYYELYQIMESVYTRLSYPETEIIKKYKGLYTRINNLAGKAIVLKRLAYYYLQTDYNAGAEFFKNVKPESKRIKELKDLFKEKE
ncbi:O-antigen ligase family protein [bacterium]|nr:O-antigen ligase family protein [bacterium]